MRMTASAGFAPRCRVQGRPERRHGGGELTRLVHAIARYLAIVGGLAMIAVIIMTGISITGRALSRFGLGPIPGDFEILQAATGFSVFAFLPWCQLNRGHATVDILTNFLSDGVNRIIDLVTDLLLLIVAAVIAWRLWVGTVEKFSNGESTFILQFPVWWGYAACVAPALGAIVIGVYMVVMRAREVAAGRSLLQGGGAIH